MQKVNIVYVIPDQLGYSAGYQQYAEILNDKGYKVSVICVDKGLKKINVDENINVQYIEIKHENFVRFTLVFLRSVFLKLRYIKKDIVVLKYYPFISLIRLFRPKAKYILDVRTGAINPLEFRRKVLNLILTLESLLFKNIFILSEDLRKELRIKKSSTILLPLGSNVFSTKNKDFITSMRLLYVGTLNKREIYKSIEGVSMFLNRITANIAISYDIIGYGNINEVEKIHNYIEQHNLTSVVKFLGRKTYDELLPYFDKANIGVSFVPKHKFYENQPPTKTYEYILSGLFCVATDTAANKLLVNCCNGNLCQDNAESFSYALDEFFKLRYSYDSNIIRNTLEGFQWSSIIERVVIPTIKSIS